MVSAIPNVGFTKFPDSLKTGNCLPRFKFIAIIIIITYYYLMFSEVNPKGL